jgi:acid phosphatase type 7
MTMFLLFIIYAKMKKLNDIYIKLVFLTTTVFFLLNCVSRPVPSQNTVGRVMDETITKLYATLEEEELNALDQQQVMSLFSESDLQVLATRHWVFDVNVPVVVSVMRSTSQKELPFWLEPSGFERTDMEIQNDFHTYEVWQKDFDAGTVELGINGFENFTYHYFVSVAPQVEGRQTEISVEIPENQYIGVLDDGAFTYHDWTELVLKNIPEEMKGQKLLTTIRGRGKESHLTGAFRKTSFPSSSEPDQVLLTWSSDPATSMDIQWRTDTSVEKGTVIYRVKGEQEHKVKEAEMFVMEDRELMNDRYIHRFTAKLKDLQPGTEYEYVIGNGDDWNNACSFSTPDNSSAFSFIWFGDVHNKPEFGELHYKADAAHPETAFYAIAGDLVGDGLYRDQWDELFEYSKDVICRKPLMNVPGNHDNRMGLGAKMYRDMFSYPHNGPEEVPPGQSYSFTYKNAFFLMLDATTKANEQTYWIDEQLAATSADWKFAIFHFPPYNWKEPYLNIQKEWVPLFDKYHVDMVFSGHLHYYMRSKPMKAGKVVESYNDGTAYIISLGIPGRQEEISEEPYAAVREQNGWLYQHIQIDGNKLSYKSLNAGGNLIDSFEIVKPE